VTHPMDIIH